MYTPSLLFTLPLAFFDAGPVVPEWFESKPARKARQAREIEHRMRQMPHTAPAASPPVAGQRRGVGTNGRSRDSDGRGCGRPTPARTRRRGRRGGGLCRTPASEPENTHSLASADFLVNPLAP